MIRYRAYQKKDIKRLCAALADSRRCIYCLPVGGGKTFVACGVIKAASTKTLFVAHRVELRDQMIRSMAACGIDHDAVTVASVRVAANLPDSVLGEFDLVVVDEGHRAGSPGYSEFLARMPWVRILGLTATPYRREGLREEFDALVMGPSQAELIAGGFVVPSVCWSVPEKDEPDMKAVKVIAGDYNQKETQKRTNKPHLVGNIVREWTEHAKISGAKYRSTLVFASGKKHAAAIVAQFKKNKIDARSVDAETAPEKRAKLVADFDAGSFPVLVNILILAEGLDVHRVDCLVLARPTKSRVLYSQAIGRGARQSPTGLDLLVLDHCGAVRAHGHPDMPREWSLDPAPTGLRGNGGPLAKRCPACGYMSALSAMNCSNCGATFRREEPEKRLEKVTISEEDKAATVERWRLVLAKRSDITEKRRAAFIAKAYAVAFGEASP